MVARPLIPVAALVAALAATGGAGAGSATFADPAGDSGTAADVTTVELRNTAANDVILVVSFANRPEWAGTRSTLYVLLDTDRNRDTGLGGADHYFFVDGAGEGRWNFGRWDGTEFVQADSAGIEVGFENGRAGFSFNARHIGGATAFDLTLFTLEGDDFAGDRDSAPDGDAWWSFTLTAPKATSAAATFAPKAPRAGGRFGVSRVTVALDDGSRAAARSYACTAKLAGRTLRPSGRCAWALPKGAKGAPLVVSVTATAPGGSTVTLKPARFRVR